MPAIKVTVLVDIDGQRELTYVHRVQTDELERFDYLKAADNNITSFATLPISTIATLRALIVQPDAAVNLRLNGQSTSLIPLNAGGLLVYIDGTAVTATLASINNPAVSAAAEVRGLGMGTNP